MTSSSGEIYKVTNPLDITEPIELQPYMSTGGQPSSLCFDSNDTPYIADLAHQALLSLSDASDKSEVVPILKEFEGNTLLGPSGICHDNKSGNIFFTDGGLLGTTPLEKPNGSIFMVDVEMSLLKPLAIKCLAQPMGIAIDPKGNVI